jgi:predicted GIY-YIG superfamily endonuclease
MKKFYLYILKCNDDSYYVGHTDDIEKRISEHVAGKLHCYTKKRLPVKVVHVQDFVTRYEALVAERKIKKWTRKKKESYIAGNWKLLSELAKRNKDRS